MLVRDLPAAVDPAEANGRAHPDVDLLTVRSRAAGAVQAAAESYAAVRRDAEVAGLVADRTADVGNHAVRLRLSASAPADCSGGARSNVTMSAAKWDMSASTSLARTAPAQASMSARI
jgi:hypothetical protein